MSVVGFDIGNENCVIAVAKQRGIDVVLNDESKRETPAVVSFGVKQRFMGLAGAACATMNPKSTISQVKRLIGRKFKEPDVQNDLKLFPFESLEGPDGGILISLEYLGEIQKFTPEHILGMLFSHLKRITETNLEMPISNCVIGIPSYFTDLQRRAFLDAAAIAGLKPLRLMHDCTATALGYGIYKTDFSDAGPTYVVFVDIGHCDTQVCIASFESGQMRIISHAFDKNLGGRDFDEVLFSYFAAQFKEQYDINVYSNAKASIRLRASCEKLKKVLSANAEAPLNIECLMDEKDVTGFIRREDFEKLSLDLQERISVPCRKALADSGLTVEKLHSVELVGSGSRIPAISRRLTSLFKREPSRTVNASECVARGCALQCAMLSPIFHVREYEVQDAFPFSIGFSSDKGPVCTLSNGALLHKHHPFPSVKIFSLRRTHIFHLEAYYADLSELPTGVSSKISSFKVGPFQASHMEATKVKVRLQLNIHGIVTVVSASQLLEDDIVDPHARSDAHLTSDKMEAESNRGFASVPNSAEDSNLKHLKPSSMSAILYKYLGFYTELERERISSNLEQIEEWLYEDGADESVDVYTEKLEYLAKLLDPIENRYKEEEARAQASKGLLDCITEYRMLVLPAGERDLIIGECNKAEQWLDEKIQLQNSLPKNADPILWSNEIKRKAEALDMTWKQIMRSLTSPPSSKDANDLDQRDESDGISMQVD
ncbi:heat shock 70 kDa protein 16-like isoform X4 [Juglans microcarpa x Juglans regia]|uniref:heat shock 70 kDa protein 16-like isoform X4 n=1 Tax=Juglans microcarpa x Juglans regia TaxID=2249226 RepID=UPI001B7DD3D2|nr:heat shock 70 kDa protein 16-like isoform X4 [Juglans microcarpa x Juglans regia]